jgi:hypothetical protein
VDSYSAKAPPALSAPLPPADAAAAAGSRDAVPSYARAPGDIYPRGARERALCDIASHADWEYLVGLVLLDSGAVVVGSLNKIKSSPTLPARFVGPTAIGFAWGLTVAGAWLAMPKCSPEWVGESPREGTVHVTWPIALSFALLAGATAPVVNAVIAGYDTTSPYSTLEREMHIVAAGLAGFGGALIPYLVPPRTWAAVQELDRIRIGPDGRGGWCFGYVARF